MFPLMSLNIIFSGFQGRAKGRKFERFSFLLGEEVKIVIFSLLREVVLKKSKSLGSSLSIVEIISVPPNISIGRSFQECTAMSA